MTTRRRHRGVSASSATGPVYFFLVGRFAFLVARLAAVLTRRVVFRTVDRADLLALRAVFFACLVAFLTVFLACLVAFLAVFLVAFLALRAVLFACLVAFLAAFFTFLLVFLIALLALFSAFLAAFSTVLPVFFTACSADRLTDLAVVFFLAAGLRGAAFLGGFATGAVLASGAGVGVGAGGSGAGAGSLAKGIGSIQPEPDQPVSLSFCSSIVYFLHHLYTSAIPAAGLGAIPEKCLCRKVPITCYQTKCVQGVRHPGEAHLPCMHQIARKQDVSLQHLNPLVTERRTRVAFASCTLGVVAIKRNRL